MVQDLGAIQEAVLPMHVTVLPMHVTAPHPGSSPRGAR